MKKFLSFFVLGATLWACTPSVNQYTIEGTVEGDAAGNALLVARGENKMDTLATAPILDGKFKLTGTVEAPRYGFVTLEGTRSMVPVVIENTKLTAVINTTDNTLSIVSGSIEQDVLNTFMNNNNELNKKVAELNKTYGEAVQAKDEEKIKQLSEEFSGLQKESEAKREELMNANPNSIASAVMLTSFMHQIDYDKLNTLYNALGENVKTNYYGTQIKERLDKLEATAIGKVAPDFTQNTPAGEPVSLHSVKGKVKIVDFWASWCGPCRQTNPSIVELYKKYHDKGLEIVGVSLDQSKEAWEKAIQDDKLTWVQISDLKYWQNEAAKLYCVNSIPHMLVLDENNVIIARNLRGEELANKIAELLQ